MCSSGKHSCCRMQITHQTLCRAHPWGNTSLQELPAPSSAPELWCKRAPSGQAAGTTPQGEPREVAKCSRGPPQHLALNTKSLRWQLPEHMGIQLCHLPSSSHILPLSLSSQSQTLSAIISQNPGHTRSRPQFGQLSARHQLQLLLQWLFIESRTTPVKETKTKTQLGQRGAHHLPSLQERS